MPWDLRRLPGCLQCINYSRELPYREMPESINGDLLVSYSLLLFYRIPVWDMEGIQLWQDSNILLFRTYDKMSPIRFWFLLESFCLFPTNSFILLESFVCLSQGTCVCLLCWTVLFMLSSVSVSFAASMELGQKHVRNFCCLCYCQLPITTASMTAFMARTQNLSLNFLVTGLGLIGNCISF